MARNLGHTAPPLYGLVLAGGRSTRLQRDKGGLAYHGVAQVRWTLNLLEGLCRQQFVSIRSEQAGTAPYQGLAVIVDIDASMGPASGLWAALQQFPGVAWLVAAADMPLLDRALFEKLIQQRDAEALATAYRHQDGAPEPLCAIWEPGVLAMLEARRAEGSVSLRRLLEAGPAKFVPVEDERAFSNVNTPADDLRVRQFLERGKPVGA